MAKGRPREYDPDIALDAALELFWTKGLAGTSLDDLSEAMAMSRPSIYNAFGGKQRIYRRALQRFCAELDRGLEATLLAEADLRTGLQRFFAETIARYYADDPARGCFVMCTAPTEAVMHADVRNDLMNAIRRIDTTLENRLQAGQSAGQFPADGDPQMAARALHATLQSAALRARAGEAKRAVRAFANYAIDRCLA